MKAKLVPIVITEYGVDTTYEVGPMTFEATMASEELREAAGFGKRAPAPAPVLDDEETDLPDEDRPAVEATAQANAVDMAKFMPLVIRGCVRKIDGVPVKMTDEQVGELSLGHVSSLFQAIYEALDLKDGGRAATTFRVQSEDDAAVGEGV